MHLKLLIPLKKYCSKLYYNAQALEMAVFDYNLELHSKILIIRQKDTIILPIL